MIELDLQSLGVEMLIKFTKSIDNKGAILYHSGSRTVLNRDQVTELYYQLDSIRSELNIDKQYKKSIMSDFLITEN